MKYKPLDGIVLTQICGKSYLIPTRKASQQCPSVIGLSLAGKIMWETIVKGDSIDDTIKVLVILLKKPEETVRKMADKFFDSLYKKGFLVSESA